MIDIALFEMGDLDLDDKRVLIREDLNVPMKDGEITNDERIKRALPTINMAVEAGARVMIASHLGRPSEGKPNGEYSLAPVAKALSELRGHPVELVTDWLDGVKVDRAQVVLLENVRFNKGENENDEDLSRKMAKLCDIFVMDAFATAHRAQASTVGIAKYAPAVCAGPLLIEEIDALSEAFHDPVRPLVAIVGGSKVSTKIHLLESLIEKVDQLIVGGGIANTFLKAEGYDIGQSLHEPDWVSKAKKLMEKAESKGVLIPLPVDVVVGKSLDENADGVVKTLSDISPEESIFDVGPQTQASYKALLEKAETIVWNGPVGVFEIEAFASGTKAIAQALADSSAYTVAGGGDTLAALEKFGVSEKISYISTGGGAFLEYLEGRELPVLKILAERAQ